MIRETNSTKIDSMRGHMIHTLYGIHYITQLLLEIKSTRKSLSVFPVPILLTFLFLQVWSWIGVSPKFVLEPLYLPPSG